MNLPPHSQTRRSGYILMEVMLATAIFAMAAVPLAVLLNDAISAGERVQRETRLVWEMQSRLNEARLLPLSEARLLPRSAGVETSEPDDNGVVYETEITMLNLKNEDGKPLTGLYDIKITARWREENQDRDMIAQTYVYQP